MRRSTFVFWETKHWRALGKVEAHQLRLTRRRRHPAWRLPSNQTTFDDWKTAEERRDRGNRRCYFGSRI
jgi:hypothetical protein